MKRVVLIAAAALALNGAAGADTRKLDLPAFTGIEASEGIEVVIVQGARQDVSIEGAQAGVVGAHVRGGRLHLVRRGWTWFGGEGDVDAKVTVTAPAISRISAAQGAHVEAHNLLAGDLRLGATQGGVIDAAGRCSRLSADASMGGMVDAKALDCGNVEASASMGGAAEVSASERVVARASMGGQVGVAGEPAQRDVSMIMGGMVTIR
jgi:Putative auto-transporter adhesin, head GIN domain